MIADTGIGMSEEFLPHIFEEFTRERTSTESKVAGTGLGMPIVKKLVDLLQGTITVESQLGKGTKFTLTLAHRIADDGQKRQLSLRSDPYRMEDFAGKRILLAEDNQLNAEIAMTILEEAGFLVEWAEDGIICVDPRSRTYESALHRRIESAPLPGLHKPGSPQPFPSGCAFSGADGRACSH